MNFDFIEWLKTGWGYFVAFGAVLASAMTISKNLKQIKDKLEEPNKKQDERIKEVESFIDNLKGEHDIFVSLQEQSKKMKDFIADSQEEHKKFTNAVKQFTELEAATTNNFDKVNNALTSLIRDRINSYYFVKCSEKGFITPIELEIVTDLYNAYSNAGGNGLISREMEIIRKIPVFNTEEEYLKWKNEKHKKAD